MTLPHEPAEVETTEEQQAIAEGREIIERHGRDNWRLGELASQLHAAGRTDQQIAELWETSQQKVNGCRRVWERFTNAFVNDTWGFAWRNWIEMLSWPNAEACLEWAADTDATYQEMRAWGRADRGEDLTASPGEQTEPSTETPPVITTVAAEPDPPICTPEPFQPEKRDPPELRPKIIESVPAEPARAPSLKKATTDALKALKTLSEAADTTERRAAAKKLRKLADELDPPKRAGRFVPPTVEQVAEYCRERGNRIEPASFVDYYRANGWKMSNGNPLKDWRAAVRQWETREQEKANGKPSQAQQREDSNAAAFEAVRRNLSGRLGANAPIVGALVQHEGSGSVHDASGSDVGDSSDAVPF